MIDRIADLVVGAPRRLILIAIVATLAIGSGAVRIKVLDDLTQVVPDGSPVRQALTVLTETFGPSETLVVMVQNPGGQIYEMAYLGEIHDLSLRLSDLRPVARVQSLAGMQVYERDADGRLRGRDILGHAPTAASEVAQIKADIQGDPDIKRAFVGVRERSVAIYVDPKPGIPDGEILSAIEEAAQPTRQKYSVHLTGMPVVRSATTQAIRHDMALLVPLVALILLGVLALTFRTFSGVALTMVIVSFSILPGAGLMGYLGIPMTAINNTFPVLILAIASAGAIHVLSIYYLRLREGSDRADAVRSVVRELAMPVFIAAMTTAAGFLSLMTSPIPPIGTLGWVVALGVVWAWMLTTFVLPAALSLVPPPKSFPTGEGLLTRMLTPLAGVPVRAPMLVSAAILATLVAVAWFGLPNLTRETRVEQFFASDAPVRIDANAIDDAFRGSTPLEMIIQESVKDPQVMRRVAAFADDVQDLPEVGSVDSIVGIVSRIQQGFSGVREVPEDEFQLGQALLLYSFSASPDQYQRFVATDESSFRVIVRMPNLDPERLEVVLARIDELRQVHLDGLKVLVTGKALFLSALNEMVVNSAVRSVLISLFLVFCICAFTFRSLAIGMEGMAPLAVAVIGVFGIMGITGLPLTIASALVSAIVIGVGVDYGVHCLARWNLLDDQPFRQRVALTLSEVGRPILLNAIAVGCGLGVLSLSRFQPIQQLGILAVIAMFTAAFGALTIIPLLKTFSSKGEP